QETIELLSRYAKSEQNNWYAVARVFDEVIPKNATIATSSAGIIPYFCNRTCLDLCGLTDPVIAHQKIDPDHRRRMGHEVCQESYDKAKERGVNIYLLWADSKPYPLALV